MVTSNAAIESPPMTTPRRALLEAAADTIDGDRNTTYGGPETSFTKIAAFWNEYLGWSDMIEPHDVAAMLALLKIARIAGSGGTHKDSWMDLAGYAACGWEVANVPVPENHDRWLENAVTNCVKDVNAAPDGMCSSTGW